MLHCVGRQVMVLSFHCAVHDLFTSCLVLEATQPHRLRFRRLPGLPQCDVLAYLLVCRLVLLQSPRPISH